MYNTPTPYDALIRSIKRKCRWTLALTTIVCIAILLFGSGMSFTVNGETVFAYEGISPIFTVLLILLALFIAMVVYGSTLLTLSNALDVECDPEKYLVLNHHLNKTKYIDGIYANGYLFLGNFAYALEYANRMIASPKEEIRLGGYFHKATACFLMGDVAALKEAVAQYAALLPCVKLSEKKKAVYQNSYQRLCYLCAIADVDTVKTKELEPLHVSNPNSKSAIGFCHYLQGIAAYQRAENEAATYHFMTVKNEMPKTVFARLADDYLALLH